MIRACLVSLLATGVGCAQLTTGLLQGSAERNAWVTIEGLNGRVTRVRAGAGGRFEVALPYGEYLVNGRPVYVSPLEARKPAIAAGALSLQSLLLLSEPGVVTEPLDFTGPGSVRLPLASDRSFSWTDTRYALNGMNATDPYQPGRPVVFPDVQAIQEVVLREEGPGYGPEIGLFTREPARGVHGELSMADARGSPAPLRETFHWFTRDHAAIGLPLKQRADFFVSGTGQWASETVPSGQDMRSRLLFGNVRGRTRLSRRDQIDGQFSGSRINLGDWGMPSGIEALDGRFVAPWGFAGEREVDHLDFLQIGWTREIGPGALEVRYGFSTAHLDTAPTSGTPPLANLAVRTRQSVQAAFQRGGFAAGGGWEQAHVRNRFSAPGGPSVVTLAGTPAFVTVLDTPTDSRDTIRTGSAWACEQLSLTRWLRLDISAYANFARGTADRIVWNSFSPRAGLALSPPWLRRLTLRGRYARFYAPLAGRYLDFGNPGSLGGADYSIRGALLRVFGGPYSTIDPNLQRPHADEFIVAASVGSVSLQFFRRDEKNRVAAINAGVPLAAFTAVPITDPGPDGIPGTYDDQRLTVYAQAPSTLGQDRYLLTNPPGLRMLNEGLVVQAGGVWRFVGAHASFMAVKSRGPANPGNSAIENDPGVIGSLLSNPNTAVHAAGRTYFDRAYIGKIQMAMRLPKALGGIEWTNSAVYLDGLVFGRRLLVTGLPQGPFFVAATVRGSPEGGNRSEYVLDWNARLSRAFGGLTVALDILNVTDQDNRLQESDVTRPNFLARLPVAIQPPRSLRWGVAYRF